MDRAGDVLQATGKPDGFTLSVRSANGDLVATAQAPSGSDPPKLAVSAGFVALRHEDSVESPEFDLWMLEPDGGSRSTGRMQGSGLLAKDPRGGVVALAVPNGALVAYDDELQPRWSVQVPLPAMLLPERTTLGADVSGNVLVLFWATGNRPGDLSGVWVTANGDVGPTFVAGIADPNNELSLEPDVTGGLFVRRYRCIGHCFFDWTGRFAPLATLQEPPPSWMADLEGLSTRIVRGGTAYAVIGADQYCFSGCATPPIPRCSIGVVGANGTTCAVIDLFDALHGAQPRGGWAANAGPGQIPCTADLDVGLDGTVAAVVRSPLVAVPCNPGTFDCAQVLAWFPAFLR